MADEPAPELAIADGEVLFPLCSQHHTPSPVLYQGQLTCPWAEHSPSYEKTTTEKENKQWVV